MILSLLVAHAFAGPCLAPATAIDLVSAIGSAETSFVAMDLEKFETSRSTAETLLGCLGEPLYPPDAAAWHRLEATAAFIKSDDAATIAAYRSSFALQPDYALPERVAPTGHPLRAWFDAARVLPPSPTVDFADLDVALYVDGTRATSHPVDRPFVLQSMGRSGRIEATVAVLAAGPLPDWATGNAIAARPPKPPKEVKPPPADKPLKEPKTPSAGSRPVALLIGTGGAALAAGTAYTLAWAQHGTFMNPETPLDELDGHLRATNSATIVSGVFAGAALGLGAAVVITW